MFIKNMSISQYVGGPEVPRVMETQEHVYNYTPSCSKSAGPGSTTSLNSYIFNENDCHYYDSNTLAQNSKSEAANQENNIEESIPDDCGEPFREQYLKIDFTPTDSPEDGDYNMNKCIAFWHFLESHKELESLKVTPTVSFKGSEQTDAWSSTTSKQDETESSKSAINWMKKTDLMTTAFSTKLETTHCDDKQDFTWEQTETEPVRELKTELKPVKGRKYRKSPKPSSLHLQQLMEEMEAWDPLHPKSFEPPGHPPNLDTAQHIRQGKYYWDLGMEGKTINK